MKIGTHGGVPPSEVENSSAVKDSKSLSEKRTCLSGFSFLLWVERADSQNAKTLVSLTLAASSSSGVGEGFVSLLAAQKTSIRSGPIEVGESSFGLHFSGTLTEVLLQKRPRDAG